MSESLHRKAYSEKTLTFLQTLVIEGILVTVAGMKFFHLQWEKLCTFILLNLIFICQFRVVRF